ncbi:MAG: HEAT repeat domain-containing protein [Proteobacteria bacterium]|nr:HEAT repeat domain-containing protein [Pseudomonadota bacterium]
MSNDPNNPNDFSDSSDSSDLTDPSATFVTVEDTDVSVALDPNFAGKTLVGTGAGTPVNKTLLGTGVRMQDLELARSSAQASAQASAQSLPSQTAEAGPVTAPGEFLGEFAGTELGGYHITRKLADGGMGEVYVAEHKQIGKRAAIKILRPEYCQNDAMVHRFIQEARAVNEIRHENIVGIFDFGRIDDGRVFLVMELLEGETLDARMKRERVPWQDSVVILEQAIHALKAAHDKGFVHRDLKPDNIFLRHSDRGGIEVKVLDFGIAKLVGMEDARDKLTRTGALLGTPHYMSPEQIDGGDVDARSDIYSLGVIMYEMFAGQRPFGGETLSEIISGHLFNDPPPMAQLTTGVPVSVEHVIRRMLVKNREARYGSVVDVLSDLKDVSESRSPSFATFLDHQQPITAQPAQLGSMVSGPASRSAPARRMSSGMRSGITAAILLAIAGGVYIAVSSPGESAAPAATTAVSEPVETAPPAAPEPPPIDHDAAKKAARALIAGSLGSSEPDVRVHACDALGDVKDSTSVPALVDLTETDPDAEVRGHAAGALGEIGARSAMGKLAELAGKAEPALRVWYAEALTLMGDRKARRILARSALDKDLAISFKAAMAMALASKPGDRKAIRALKKLARREAELNDIAPYAGVAILANLVRLGDAEARQVLYKTLEHSDEGARVAAAEGLSRLGDEAGKTILLDVLGDQTSDNRPVAARALIAVGDYSGYDILTEELGNKDPDIRRMSARGLGEIGEKSSLRPLLELYQDSDHTVRIAAATAIMTIIGLDPVVLAQASVDWARSALKSQDWAVRQTAAATLGDISEEKSLPLLAQAIVDPDRNVRRAAAESAAKMKSPEAAKEVAEAAKAEKDPEVKELQVVAMGKIKSPVAKEALTAISQEPGRVGVLAAGSLIAVGELDASKQVEQASQDRKPKIRVAAMESAKLADNQIVVPTLQKGAADRVFDVRFAAAEGLAYYRRAKETAIKVLKEGIARTPQIQGRAFAALLRFGVALRDVLGGDAMTTEAMLASSEVTVRQAAIPVIAAMKWQQARPLLRRAIFDAELEVKRDAVDAIAGFVDDDKKGTVRLYKLLINDTDGASRAKAKAQLARLVTPEPVKTAQAPPPPPPPVEEPAAVVDTSPAQQAAEATGAARVKLDEAAKQLDALLAQIKERVARPAKDDEELDRVEELGRRVPGVVAALKAAANQTIDRAEQAIATITELQTQAPDMAELAQLADQATKQRDHARAVAAAVQKRVAAVEQQLQQYRQQETADPGLYLEAANAAIATGKLSSARRDLNRARRLYRAAGKTNPMLFFGYGQLYDEMALQSQEEEQRLGYLKQAKSNYDRFVKIGKGARVGQAKERSAEIAQELAGQ